MVFNSAFKGLNGTSFSEEEEEDEEEKEEEDDDDGDDDDNDDDEHLEFHIFPHRCWLTLPMGAKYLQQGHYYVRKQFSKWRNMILQTFICLLISFIS